MTSVLEQQAKILFWLSIYLVSTPHQNHSLLLTFKKIECFIFPISFQNYRKAGPVNYGSAELDPSSAFGRQISIKVIIVPTFLNEIGRKFVFGVRLCFLKIDPRIFGLE